jgi:hypothetical protein
MKSITQKIGLFLLILFFTSSCVGAIKKSLLDPKSFLGFYLSLDPFKLNPPPKSKIIMLTPINTIQEGESAAMGILLENNPYKQITVTCQTDYPSLLVNGSQKAEFIFNSTNFSQQQSISLTTVIDNDDISDTASLKCTAPELAEVTTSILVSDTAGIILSGTVPTLQEGNNVTIGVRLSRKPSGTATVLVSLNNNAVTINGTTSLSLTFTPSNYNTSQDISILALIDANSTNDPTTLTFKMTGIPDVTYNLTIVDDNVIQLTGPPSSITEGLSTTMGIRFSKSILTNNSITITSSNPAAITVDGGASATFNYTPLSSTSDQIVTLAAVLDANLVSETVSLTLTTTGMAPLVIVVSTIDVDTQNLVITGAIPTLDENTSGPILVHLTNSPSSNVTVNVTTSNGTSLSVSPSTLTFNAANYNIDQTITVSALNDVNETAEYLTVIFTSPSAPMQVYNITTIDDDTKILLSGATSVNEGNSSIVTVSLSGDPGIARTVTLSSSNLLAMTLGTTILSFSPGNYSQSIPISGVQDANIISETVTLSATSGTPLIAAANTNISTVDDDTMNILLTAGTNQVSEGATTTFTVRLTQEPSPSLTVNLASSIAGSVSLSTASITFDNVCPGANCWSTAQTVTVTGVEDVNETSETSLITASAAAVTSVTQNYATIENDTKPVFAGATTVTENSTALVTVALSGDPGAARTLNLVSSNTLAMTLSPATLIFNSANWNIPQTVLVTGVSDANIIAEAVTITGSGVSLVTATTIVNTVDVNTMSIILAGNPNSINEGGTANFTVKLGAEPTPSLVVSLASGTVGSVTVGTASITFDNVCPGPNCWSTAQTVTMSGVEDVNETTETVTITATAPATTNATFNIDTADNDSKAVFTGATTVTENGTSVLMVQLSGNPNGARTLNLVSSNLLAVTLSTSTLTFNATNWNVPQSVTVTGVSDANIISEAVTITGSGVDLGSATATINTVDVNTMSIILAGNPTSINEGGTANFTVKLGAEPTPSLVVSLASGTAGSVSLGTASITFDNVCPGPNCWSTAQTVTMSGVEDVNETTETVAITATAPATPNATFNIDTADNDSKAVFTGATTVTENGTSVLLVQLSGNPNGARTLNLVSSNLLAVTLSTSNLTFNATNWNVPQSVTMTGVSDANIISETVTITGSGVDLGSATTVVNTVDINTMSIILAGNPNSINEGGTANFTVKLGAEPTPSLVVSLASGTVGSVTVGTASITFDNVCPGPNCWSTAQTVTMSGVEDVNETTETVTITATAPATTNATFNIDTADNDSKAVFTGATTVTENGTSVLMVQLSGNPNGARTLNLVSSNLLAVTLSTSTLTFNATNWNVPQSVTVTGVSDANIISEAVTITGSGVDLGSATATINTVDVNTMSIILAGNPTSINEGGTSNFTVKLGAEPTPSLVVSLTSGTVGSVSLGTASITFDNICPGPNCWSTAQTVTMSGVEDVNETTETVAITATAPATTNATFNIDTADNDSKAVFTGATTVNEGSTALLSVALSGNPNGTRTMNLVSGNTAAITITPATLTFNASNWNIPQAVLMTGVADANTSAETVTITASGVDLGGATTNVSTVDSTVIAIILTPSGTTVAEGGTSTLDVKLSAEPSPSTTVTLATSNAGSVSLSTTTLTFDNVCPGPNCWSSNQTVTLTGVEDVNETSENVTISATAPSVTSASSSFDTIENDTKPVFTGATSVTEGGVAFVSVALSGNPGAARTLNLASSNTLALAVLPTTVSFNTTNWNIPQSILVSGISDANIIAEAVTITGSGVGLVSATTIVNTVDINTMSIILAGNPTSINEGGTANFTVKLGAEPTPSLVVSLASGTAGSVTVGTASITFDNVCPGPNCWSTAQTITMTGVEDVNETTETVAITATAPATTNATFNIDTADNDSKAVFTGATTVTENGTSVLLVQLSGNPNGARTLNLVSSNLLAVTLSTSTLTFNATNWNVPQSVTMTGVSDANIISEAVTITGSGVDLGSATATINTVDVNTMSIILAGNPTSINEGGTANFTVKLGAEPTPSLVVSLASGTVGSVSLGTASITFDNVCPGPNCWSTAQTVTMTGVEDVNETTETVAITATAPATTAASFNIDTADNDSKAVFTGATTVNEGSTALLSVALSGNPNGTRTMNLVSGNTAAITITPATLTFNASNWNIPQAVLMTGVADANTSAETVTITASGVDLGGATTNVSTVDSTVIAIILTPSGTTVAEGGTSTLDVKLSAEPSPSTTVTLATSNVGSVSLSTTTLTFDNVCPGVNCWSTNKTVTLTGVEEVNETSENVTISATAPSVTSASSAFDTIENDTKPVFTGATSVTEGGVAFLSVALSGNPGAARTLNLSSSNTLALAVLPTTISFNTTNWNIPQSILVSGISDANIIAEAVTITGSGVGLVSATTIVNTVDINTMSIILAGNPTSINEGGTANFTVKLGAEPTPSLVVSLASGTVGSVTVGTASITFDNVCPGPNCWSTAQTVTMTGVEDVNETTETVAITATAPATPNATFNIDTADNDSKAVFTGATTVTENGTSVLMVQLSGNPNGARTLNLVSSNLLAVTLSTSTLTFNATNWNVPQSVTMTGVSDANIISEAVTITGSGVDLGSATATINTVDVNTMSIILAGNPTSINEGGTANFTVKLGAEPTPSLVVSLASGTDGSVSLGTASITFDNVCPGANCWSTAQTVTMTGVEDVNETTETVAITATAPATTAASFNIDTADNDSKAVFTGATTVNEGSTALLSVALSGNPNGTRTMNLISGNTAAITITPATLTFNASNWNIPQAVLMTGVSDANTSAETVTITASGVDLGGATTNVTTVDSTIIAIILTPSGTTVAEGGSSTLDVKLSAEPSPTTTVTLATSNLGSVSLSTTTLTFDNVCPGVNCWSTNKTVTLTGVEDVNETSENVTISATAPSVTSASSAFDTIENDTKPVFTGATSVTEGGVAFVSVALSGNPGAARTLNLSSSNTLALAVLPTTISFNTTNWNIPQSILVSGISDANIIAEAVTITGSGVGLVSATTVVNTVDINTMSIILAGNPTSINEGGTANFTVKLGAEPTPSLVVSLASGTAGSVTVGTASITFDNVCPGPNCWSTTQTVTMTGVEDVNETTETVAITATAPATTAASFNIDTADNDSKAVFTGATTVNEGSTALLSVALSGNPNGTRTMNLVSGNTAAITITPATLTFNASNWNIPQALLMTGVSDANTSAETVTITASGVDLGGATTNVSTVDSTVIAIILTPSGTTVAEGGTSTIDVKLSAEPSPSTTVTLATSNAGSVSLSTTTLTFDNVCPGVNCWSTNKTVTLTGVEEVNETSENVTISATAPSVTSASSAFDTIENDTKPVFTGSVSVTEGSTSLIAVALSGNPGATRTVTIGSSNTLAVTASPTTLTFTTTNWNVPQAVLLTGVTDANTASESVTITGSGAGIVSATTTISTVDSGTMTIILSAKPTTINEGGTTTFQVALSNEPSTSLIVSFASGTAGSVSLATASFTFDNICPGPACWSTAQTITLNGLEEANETSETVTITATAPATTSASFNLDTADNDSKAVFTGATSVNEGGTALISVALSGNPGATRTMNISSSNTLAITLLPATLTFNAANWNVPQSVLLTGVTDANTVAEAVTITGSGVDLGTATTNVSTVDINTMNIVLTAAATAVGEGSSTSFSVNLSQEPSPSLVVSFASSNAASVTVAPVSVTFDNVCPGAQCWSSLRTITLNGVVDANQTTETVTITASAPAVPNATFTISTTENDAQPVFTGVTTVTEGGTALLSVSLSGNPGANRTLNLTSSNPAAITISPATLNFTAANWNVPQAVVLSGLADANAASESVTITGSGVDLGTASTTITTVDSNTMSIVLSAATTIVDEGSSASFNVKLSQEPSPSLVVSFASSNVASATVAPASVTFDNVCPGANCWSSLKTITVTGVEDINETTETVTITASAPAVPNSTLNFDTTDNDSRPVFTGAVTVNEGGTSLISVALSGNPGAARTMNLTSSNTAAITIAPATLSFNAANWNVPQSVLLSGVADANTASETVTITGNGTDLGTNTVSINTVDTSSMSIILTAASTTVSEGGTATMNVKLSSEPSPSLIVTMASSNIASISASPLTLTFDNVCPGAQCWSTNQTVTLTGAEDANQSSESVTISASAPATTGASLNFTTIENDTSVVLGGAVSVTEGNNAYITVTLTGDPGADRTITLTSSDTSALIIFPPTITFTSTNWNNPQTVQVTGVSDVNTIAETVTITAAGAGITTATGTVNTVDTNVFDLVVTNVSGTTTVNEGSSLSFSVALNFAPVASPYTVTISAPQTSAAVPGYVATPTYVIDPANSGVGSTTLTFTTANYATPQTVTINAPENYYIDNKTTTLSFAGAGVTTKNYSITVVDNDPVEHMLVDDGMGPACNDVSTSYDGVKMLVAAQCSNGGTFNRVKAFRCESNLSYCLDTNSATLDNGGDNNARSLTALYNAGQAMIISENKTNGRMNFFTGPLGSWTYYDMSDVAKFNLGNTTSISPRAAWDATNSKVIVATSYTSGLYLYSFDKFGNSLNTPVNIPAANMDPGIMIETVTDTTNSKVTVTFQYQPVLGQYALAFVQCNLDLTGCSAPATFSSLIGNMADGNPLWIKHSQGIYDVTTNKFYLITSMANTEGGADTIPKLIICNPNMTGCSAQTIYTANRSGIKTKIAVDNFNNKLLILAYDSTQSYSVELNRCSLTGTGCTRKNLTGSFGMNIGSNIANPFIDTVNKKLRFVAINNASGGVLSMFSMLLYID